MNPRNRLYFLTKSTKPNRSRLIDKVRHIVDDDLVKLISDFCNLPVVDNIGREFDLNTCFPPTAHYLELLPPAYLFPPQVFNQPSPRLSLSTIHLSHNPLSFFIRE